VAVCSLAGCLVFRLAAACAATTGQWWQAPGCCEGLSCPREAVWPLALLAWQPLLVVKVLVSGMVRIRVAWQCTGALAAYDSSHVWSSGQAVMSHMCLAVCPGVFIHVCSGPSWTFASPLMQPRSGNYVNVNALCRMQPRPDTSDLIA
jgi:hypothetical protein